MNILIPDSLLREYLQTKAEATTIAKEVALCGPSVERVEMVEGEPVYDVEITTNRVDTASVRGFAREAAVILRVAGISADFVTTGKVKSLALTQFAPEESLPLPKVKMETDKVKRILAVVLSQVQDSPTPLWMAKRLRQIGENVHSSVIDITNYVTHELGHPCHAFDYDKIMALGGEIVIKQAVAGKKFVTLDGTEHQTVGGEIVFESKTGEIIDLPAIKGTLNTAIDEKTTKVLFWLENMEAQVVRQASMRHGIRTVAAILNEKNVDPALASEVMAKGILLFQDLCQAKVASPIFDEWREKNVGRSIQVKLERVNDYLGIKLEVEAVTKILRDLEFAVVAKEQGKLEVTPPSFRAADVQEQADVIEEVARIYGYAKLPSNLNFATVAIAAQPGVNFAYEKQVQHFLAGKGLNEVYTYSTVSAELVQGSQEEQLRLANPLNDDLVYLRQNLYPSLLKVYEENQGKTAKVAGIFELAKVYFPGETDQKVREEMRLSVLTDRDYRTARTWLNQVLSLGYLLATVNAHGEIWLKDGDKIGQMGVQTGKTFFELNLDLLAEKVRKYPHYQPISNQPAIVEDLTFVVPLGKNVGPLMEKMQMVSPLIKEISLKDVYQQNYTFNYIYQKPDEVLNNEEIAVVRKQVVAMMAENECKLVGKL